MEHNKELETFNFQALLEKRRNKENGIQTKVDRISNEERMDKMITELIIKITISSIVIGLKNSCFPLIHLSSCYRTFQ